ncbi:unnamed protein product [Porites evermanni]|uniref:Ig-like domain-containing protein n=1 Tax=Porites evermanni TaxID=104178 RepID=A0ABN8LKQ9_9CNID|nr:unnamed protein product [Porites evermanni]
MASFAGKLPTLLALFLVEKAEGTDKFGIVKPFPENIYPIERTSAEVTCVAFDLSTESKKKTPERILFMRRNKSGRYTIITETENIYFRNRTEEVVEDGKKSKKLFVTMVIRNVTLNDDSTYGTLGRYECHAFAVGDPVERKHGFYVNVILKTEIPTVTVPEVIVLRHSENITLACNLTEGEDGGNTGLKSISWYKDGVLKKTLRNPEPGNPQGSFEPLKLSNVGVKDGGNYTCLLIVLLRNKEDKKYSVSDSTMVEIAAWLDKQKVDPEYQGYKGRNVSLECPAKGFPLHVEWKFKKKGEDKVRSCIGALDGKYRIHRKGIYEPYFLTLTDLQYSDRGSYYCCLPSNCSDSVQGNCQRFVLRVRDPLGPLWPVIGIIVEAIVLFLIIFIAEKRSKNKKRGTKAISSYRVFSHDVTAAILVSQNNETAAILDKRVEFRSSSSIDSDRGQVRLRKVGETADA